MRDETHGILTTQKIQSLIDLGINPQIRTRRALAEQLVVAGEKISKHGVEAWFRNVDSNYNEKRPSLSEHQRTYPIPRRRWQTLIDLLSIEPEKLELSDDDFHYWCLNVSKSRPETPKYDWSETAPEILIGRDEEFSIFHEFGNKVMQSTSSILAFEAEPGIGKTHFLDACWLSLASAACTRLRTVCMEDVQIPMFPLLALLRHGVQESQLRNSQLHKDVEQLERTLFSEKHIEAQHLDATFLQFLQTLKNVNQESPLIILVDDAQWMDEPTTRLLTLLMQTSTESPGLGILLAKRPVSKPLDPSLTLVKKTLVANSKVHYTEQTLKPLSIEAFNHLLTTKTEIPPSVDLVTLIHEHALGNPLLGIELISNMSRDQKLFQQDGVLHTKITPDELLTRTDMDAIYKRVFESLSEKTQKMLLTAAAYNKSFSIQILQSLFPRETIELLLSRVEEAEAKGIIHYDNDLFSFRHATIRNAIYRAASAIRTAQAHAEIAERLKTIATDNPEMRDIEIAHHLTRCVGFTDTDILAEYCYRAVKTSRAVQAWDQMIRFSEQALKHGKTDDPRRTELLAWAGSAHHMSGNPQQAVKMMEQARTAFLAENDQKAAANILALQVRIRGNFGLVPRGELADAEMLADIARKMLNQEPKSASLMFDALASRYMYARKPKQALDYAQQAFSAVRLIEPCEERAIAGVSAGVASLEWLDIDGAAYYFSDAEETAMLCRDEDNLDRARQRLTIIHMLKGELNWVDIVVQRLRESNRLVKGTGEFGLVLAALVSIYGIKGEFSKAEEYYAEGMALANASGYLWAVAFLTTAIAGIRLSIGEVDWAGEALNELENYNPQLFAKTADKFRRVLPQTDNQHIILDSNTLPKPGEPYNLFTVARIAMETEFAIQQGNLSFLEKATESLKYAYDKSIVVPMGWPVLLPRVIAQANMALDKNHSAQEFHAVGLHLAKRLGCKNEQLLLQGLRVG